MEEESSSIDESQEVNASRINLMDLDRRRLGSFKNAEDEKDEDCSSGASDVDNNIKFSDATIALKHHEVNRSIFRRQIVMIATILSLIALLSTYFIISYFLSIRTFNTAEEVILDLEIVFQKG
jgi:hypothetical protein